MINVFNTKQCKLMDEITINEIGIPGIILMENAAMGIVQKIVDKSESFLFFCGKGNNGGDGLAIARHLFLKGKRVKVYVVSKNDSYSDDFRVNHDILKNLGGKDLIVNIRDISDVGNDVISDLCNFDVVLDGIFGVGLNRDLETMFAHLVKIINQYSRYTVSIDTPSGFDCEMGIERGISIKAKQTYTFEVLKKGFLNYKAYDYTGKVDIIKIGIPENVKEKIDSNISILDIEQYKGMIPIREKYGHKGNYGRAIVVAGSKDYIGAAFITTECTVRTGAGLTTVICKDSYVQEILSQKLIESMTAVQDEERVINLIRNADSIAFGPGVGTGEKEVDLLTKIVANSKCPIVIDADGITILSKNKYLLDSLKGRCIITPHPGEMARFCGISIEDVERDRICIAKNIAKKYNIVVLLKGYYSIITDGNKVYINRTGNSKMASGGMGDALTGIINSFISQGVKLLEAALISAYIHGSIVDDLSSKVYIVNARDIIDQLPIKINSIIKQ